MDIMRAGPEELLEPIEPGDSDWPVSEDLDLGSEL
jgi:hypothetical protein